MSEEIADFDEEEEEELECSSCGGFGEFAGDPNTNYFEPCSRCRGTGIEPQD